MLALVFWGTSEESDEEGYLLAHRDVGVVRGAFSIAVSWIWAPAIFFCSLKAYLEGLPGIFWFTVPNVLCFAAFAFLVVRIRRLMPSCYSMPDFLANRFPNAPGLHIAGTIVVLIIDIVAVLFNSLVGAFLLNTVAGIPFVTGVILMTGVALVYSLWRGFPASVVTDIVQMAIILLLCFCFVPWAVAQAGGLAQVRLGFGGVTGLHRTIFETEIAFSWGIPASISLLAVPFADQMFYQRAFAAREAKIWSTFLLGGIIFGMVPVTLSFLGFLGANPEIHGALTSGGQAIEPLMVNVKVLGYLLPTWTVAGFALMAICALSSTLDSAYCAIASILSRDIYQQHIRPDASQHEAIRFGRIGMAVIALLAALIVCLVPLKGEWLFNINGSVASCVVIPLFLTVFWRRLTAQAAFYAMIIPLVIGGPIAIYANVSGNARFIVASMVGILVLSTLIAVISSGVGQNARNMELDEDVNH